MLDQALHEVVKRLSDVNLTARELGKLNMPDHFIQKILKLVEDGQAASIVNCVLCANVQKIFKL